MSTDTAPEMKQLHKGTGLIVTFELRISLAGYVKGELGSKYV